MSDYADTGFVDEPQAELDAEVEPTKGPRELREHAKDLERDLKKERTRREAAEAELTGYLRRDAFEKVTAEAARKNVEGVEHISLEDLGELPPADITLELVTAKAIERHHQREALAAELAGQFGMRPEELQTAVSFYRDQREALALQADIALGGSPNGLPSGTSVQSAARAHEGVKRRGGTTEDAEAAGVGALIERQVQNEHGPRRW